MSEREPRITPRSAMLAVAAVLCVAAGFGPPLTGQTGGGPASPRNASDPVSIREIWKRLLLPTNSLASAARGHREFGKKKFEEAAKSFDIADHLAPDLRSAFNLGTAQIAAGRNSEGSATLSRAMRDAILRPDALFNRGNSALASKAYEYAIRDYVETLKLRPSDAAAKRNLEIALQRLEEMQRSSSPGGSNKQQPQQQSQNQQKAPSAGQQQQTPQQGDAEALLRSVQQQEQEELQRMKRERTANVRIGW